MKLHQRDYFRKKLLNRLDWLELCWKGKGWKGGSALWGQAGPPASTAASVALLLLVRMCLPLCSVTVNGVREQELLDGQELVSLSF